MRDQFNRPLSVVERLRRMPKWYRYYRTHRFGVIPAVRAAWIAATAY